MSHNNAVNGRHFLKELKQAEKALRNDPLLNENQLFNREIKDLIRNAPNAYFTLRNGYPLLGKEICALAEISDATVADLIYTLSQTSYIKEEDLMSLIWQCKLYTVLLAASGREKPEAALNRMYRIRELDENALETLSPLHKAFSSDPVYLASSRETRSQYRRKAALISRLTGIEETRYTSELSKRALLGSRHIGEIIEEDYRNIYPHAKAPLYIVLQLLFAVLLSAGTGFLTGFWTIPITFLPFWGITKAVADMVLSRFSRAVPLPRLEIESALPDSGKTVCVMSALINDGESLKDALTRLKTARLKNPQQNIFFCLLADLSPADSETTPEDEALFRTAETLRREILPESAMIFRKRRYSETMGKYQGFDRKRGAIEELVKYMNGLGENFYKISGDISVYKDCAFIAALDLDTVPLMDSVKELAAIALHPLNDGYGIIAPRCTSSLGSTLATPFTGAMAGNGGVSGISAYDSFSGEFYFDIFGEGIFCGKGLLRKTVFLNDCCDKFKPERVLSHDILEGSLTGVAYAGDVEFSDSFPPSSKPYFKRAHRWLRGDFQNFRYMFRKDFSPLSKFKLADNIRRGLNPIFVLSLFFLSCFIRNGFLLGIIAYLSLLLPFIPALASSIARGLPFGINRRFYSPIVSEAKQLASKALLEIMTLPKSALTSLDALAKTLWRNIVSKKNLLQWTTSGFLEKNAFKGSVWHLVFPFLVSLLLLFFCVNNAAGCPFPAALLMCAAFPFFVYSDKPRVGFSPSLNEAAKKELLSQTEKMWRFYTDYVNEKTNFLPPDNVQFSPVYRVCMRTSPTNIGMYLLSAAAVFELGIINADEFVRRLEKTVGTVEKLPKWEGNLYNWYDLSSLKIVSGFVSSVDSGNFFCCLIAVKECLKLHNLASLLRQRIEVILEQTVLSAFYEEKYSLFSIGFDTNENKLSPHKYDMLMSEARLLSYAAIATGQAPKAHWRALSRTMSKSGAYAGAVAWTGTMFEFFMPELLIASKEGSMCYESLKYAFHCQKHRHTPFGISESGYYAFDSELNYQYKAHGVQKTALKGGMDRECVVSPYSSYLTLSLEPLESWNNLCRLEKEGAFNPKYGFYEAVDYTKRRVGRGGAVIKSHMAHHMGMSIAGAANLLKDNICSKLFLNDEKIKRAEELSEEKVMAGEKILNMQYRSGDEKMPREKEEIRDQVLKNSPVNTLTGGSLSLFTSANGLFCGNYKNVRTVNKTSDYLNRPHGAFYGYCDGERVYPFFYHPKFKNRLHTLFSENETVYTVEDKNYSFEMTVRAMMNTELRRFTVKNRTRAQKQLTLCLYSEPTLAAHNDYSAHPMFMDLFLKADYDEENRLFVFSRKSRDSNDVVAVAAGFVDENADYTYCLSKEACLGAAPFSFFEKALIRECTDRSVPSPCLFVKNNIILDSGETSALTVFYCYGDSVDEAVNAALKLRREAAENGGNVGEKERYAPSPLSLSTLHGRMAAAVLPALLYGEVKEEKILKARRENKLNRQALWQYSISGDYPLLVFSALTAEEVKSAVMLKQGLNRCGVKSDLVILCENALEKSAVLSETESGAQGGAYVFVKSELPADILNLIYSLAATVDKNSLYLKPPAIVIQKPFLPLLPCTHKREENGFTDGGYVISHEENTWCNILSNAQFGTLMSQNSLGFTWAVNSRENKLTAWENDPIADNGNELLLLRSGRTYYDIIRGSKAEFTPEYCRYTGSAGTVEAETTVKVYTKGLGKEITVTLIAKDNIAPENGGGGAAGSKSAPNNYYQKSKNKADSETPNFYLIYKLNPLLGDRREMSMPTAHIEDGVLVISNSQNPNFHGAAAVCCNKRALFSFSEEEIRAGDFSRCLEKTSAGERLNADTAAVIVPLTLPPREKLRIRFILGYCENAGEAASYVRSLDGTPCGLQLENSIEISTPDSTLNSLFNTWLPHQAVSCRLWGRTGFFQNGGGYGFRDQLQDCLAIMYLSPQTALEHIFRCCQSQFPEGDVLHWWHELNGKRVGVRTRCSDDLLWLPYVACEYAKSFGDSNFWNTEAEYCSGKALAENEHELYMQADGSGVKESLFLHCKKAMEKGLNKGKNGLLKMGGGDWNDGYNRVGIKGVGESVWLSMFYVLCGRKFAPIAREQGDGAYADELEKEIAEMCLAIEESAWDEDHYLRAFYDNGKKMGASESEMCRIDLLPQAFAALCGLPDTGRVVTASNTAYDQLVDEKSGIIKLFSPPFSSENDAGNSGEDPGYVRSYPIGVRENGGQYTHGAVWYCLSCFELGQNKRAFDLLNMLNPALKDERFGREPYFMTADIYTNPHCYGRGGWSMYTGAAAWYWKCIFEGLFGAEVEGDTVKFEPRLPAEFDGAEMKLKIGGKEIRVKFRYKGCGGKSEVRLGEGDRVIDY